MKPGEGREDDQDGRQVNKGEPCLMLPVIKKVLIVFYFTRHDPDRTGHWNTKQKMCHQVDSGYLHEIIRKTGIFSLGLPFRPIVLLN